MPIDIFLSIEDIKGESVDDKHKDEIDILSWSWGMTNEGSAALGGGQGAGKVNVQDMSFTKFVDKASADLLLACASGQRVRDATLFVRRSGERPLEYLIVKMSDILVTSVQQDGDAGQEQEAANESFAFNFAKVEWKYIPQNDKGDPGEPKVFGWDIAKNKPL